MDISGPSVVTSPNPQTWKDIPWHTTPMTQRSQATRSIRSTPQNPRLPARRSHHIRRIIVR